jgi:magnesium-transporting ATPase (P-type)
MIGGGAKLQKIFSGPNFINIMIFSIFLILIRTYIVQITYNMMWPKIVTNTGGDNSQFTPLTFYESLMMVILFSFLFRI